jgi:hypothetical protein
VNAKPNRGDFEQLKKLTDATLIEVISTLTEFCRWLEATPSELPYELLDRLGIRLLAMVGHAQLLCQQTSQARLLVHAEETPTARSVVAQAEMAPPAPDPSYTELVHEFGLVRTVIRELMMQSKSGVEVDPGLKALLEKLSRGAAAFSTSGGRDRRP